MINAKESLGIYLTKQAIYEDKMDYIVNELTEKEKRELLEKESLLTEDDEIEDVNEEEEETEEENEPEKEEENEESEEEQEDSDDDVLEQEWEDD